MTERVSTRMQVAIGLAAMAATMSALIPATDARGSESHDSKAPAAGLFGSIRTPGESPRGSFDTF